MKKHNLILALLITVFLSCSEQRYNPEIYVNPLIGTDIRVVEGKDHNSTEERGQIMPALGT